MILLKDPNDIQKSIHCLEELDVFSTDEKGLKKEKILSHFMIIKNATYFYFKGNGQITFKDGTKIELLYCRPIAPLGDIDPDGF